jgi:Fe-S-cluster containining protein
LLEAAEKSVDEVKHLSEEECLTINQRCIFLRDEQCSIYSVRPSECRKYHSVDLGTCRLTFEQPNDLNIVSPYDEAVHFAGSVIKEGFEKSTMKLGLDQSQYELNSAFLDAMKNPAAEKRYAKGKKAFLSARS